MGNRPNEFDPGTQFAALKRQIFRCASCGAEITALGEAGREDHEFGEIAHAHHMVKAMNGGNPLLDNCVILCQSCHYSAHEGGRYWKGTVEAAEDDFEFFNGPPKKKSKSA
jgi:5-methylcytosine-specific restriction endonuclease McrA